MHYYYVSVILSGIDISVTYRNNSSMCVRLNQRYASIILNYLIVKYNIYTINIKNVSFCYYNRQLNIDFKIDIKNIKR